ncbi:MULTISPECIES: glycoside hydrolase family 43 protein [Amycolatopsis]|uniref:glycoside hydrolase family 43 protein n=1 Tax=Amycolatopsis TaxID=1813 RepID=UPI000B8AC54F|nr:MULTISPECIES: glycoside hydrolase family 43 protein [Amycolatopsis]OXM74970.1 glycoside hydrolase [Amycolatopsis sp. KNN50.9b]
MDTAGTITQAREPGDPPRPRRRPAAARALTCLGILLASALLPGAVAQAAPAPRVLLNQDFPDPDVLKIGSGYHAFATTGPSGRIPVAAAADADGPWRVAGDALAADPPWADPKGGYWAPDVTRRADGTFLMYYAAVSTRDRHRCIGTAVANSVAGPYQPTGDGPLICDPGDQGDIDPQTFQARDGTRYLLYKGERPGGGTSAIFVQKMTQDGTATDGPRTEILRADRPEENGVVEAPVITQRGGRFVLFYSADDFRNTTYQTRYATASALTGPYTKAGRPLLTTESIGRATEGPGGADVVGGRVFFHGWLNGQRAERGLFNLNLEFVKGVPQVS